jgi:uncharacterized protein YqgV (UPF0045/DUF77 family)
MGTIIEGKWKKVMAVVTACHTTMSADCERISTTFKIDYRAGASGRLKSKIESVQQKLGRKLFT